MIFLQNKVIYINLEGNKNCMFFQFDAEIVFLEGKEREKQRQLDFLTQEIIVTTNLSKSNQEQVSRK